MKSKRCLQMAFLFVLGFSLIAVVPNAQAARVPSPKRVQNLTTKFFHKYGKEYPETIFGFGNLDAVQINQIFEVSYKVVFADVMLRFKNGKMGRAIVRMKSKFPKGWHVISWEMVGVQ